MSEIFFRDDRSPGAHALIVGVGDYQNLPDHGTPAPAGGFPPRWLGLTKLDSAALSAFRIACWLRDHARDLNPPLASIRLLLAPTATEIRQFPELSRSPARFPLLNTFVEEVVAWRNDSKGHGDNLTLFYFAGHGVQRGFPDPEHILLFSDFGGNPLRKLAGTINTTELFNGMKNTDAGRQIYFYDACRLEPKLLNKEEVINVDTFWDYLPGTHENRKLGVYHSTRSGQPAYGVPGGHSFFCEALLSCLDAKAAIKPKVDNPTNPQKWRITPQSLNKTLSITLAEVASKKGVTQVLYGITPDEFELRFFDKPPKVPIIVDISPGPAREYIEFALRTVKGENALLVPPPIPLQTPESRYVGHVEAGIYVYHGTDRGNPQRYTNKMDLTYAEPPEHQMVLQFDSASVTPPSGNG